MIESSALMSFTLRKFFVGIYVEICYRTISSQLHLLVNYIRKINYRFYLRIKKIINLFILIPNVLIVCTGLSLLGHIPSHPEADGLLIFPIRFTKKTIKLCKHFSTNFNRKVALLTTRFLRLLSELFGSQL